MARTRRTCTPEFKAKAVKLVTEQGYSVAEAASLRGRKITSTKNGTSPSPPTSCANTQML